MKLANYAVDPTKNFGRIYKEKFGNEYEPFLKDRERIIHSAAFRRLEYKTQVFVNHAGDHYRTRLTHSLEVAQITRNVCRQLRLNEDVAETIALSHDLGHPPFGHAGEEGLNNAAKEYGGFDHNIQTIKIVTKLEQRYAEFDGLNLSLEILEGIIKHNGPIKTDIKKLPKIIQELAKHKNIKLNLYPSLEAQVASLADDIAYCNHDIDDGIRAGMFGIEELTNINLIKKIYDGVQTTFQQATQAQLLNETIQRLIKHMIDDVVIETHKNIELMKIRNLNDIKKASQALVKFSKPTEVMRSELKRFLMMKVYRNYRVNRMSYKSKQVIKDIFNILLERNECLPSEWQSKLVGKSKKDSAEIIIDYIAGMTDRYAIEEHVKLFNPKYF